jgi:hypothetical protein
MTATQHEETLAVQEPEETQTDVPSVDYEAPVIAVPTAHTCSANCY